MLRHCGSVSGPGGLQKAKTGEDTITKAKANSGAPPKRSSFLFFNKLKQDNQFFQQNNKVKTLDMRREPTCDFCCVQDVRDPYN